MLTPEPARLAEQTRGFTIWLTGLPAAGKSTIGVAIEERLKVRGRRVEFLDGDRIRAVLGSELGFSAADRNTNIRRIGFLAQLLSRNGVAVIVAAVSPYRATRREVRLSHEAPFIEVFVECALEEVIRRDPKGLYKEALHGDVHAFTGVSDPYEPPESSEIRLRTDMKSLEECVTEILRNLEDMRLLDPEK